MKYSILICIALLFSCNRYEKKVLKVEITYDQLCMFAWDDNTQYGICEKAGNKTLYLKEGSTLKFKMMACQSPKPSVKLTVKTNKRTLYENSGGVQTVNVLVERK